MIDTVQRKLVSCVMKLTPSHGEDAVEYMRRRNREATALMRRVGKWSEKHCSRVIAWNDHLQRPRNCKSWPVMLLKFRDSAWIEQQRMNHSTGNESRTCTCASPGFVAMRWHDGVKLAAERCPR